MQTNNVEQKPVKEKEKFSVRFKKWHSFNKQKIPFYFMIASVLIITGTLDFKAGNIIELKSHINAILQLDTNIVAFYLFVLNLLALVQAFFTFSFSKAQAPKTLILNTVLTIVHVVITVLYVMVFLTEKSRVPSYKPGNSAMLTIIFMSLGALFMTISTAFAWKYVNWKYVKIED